MFSYIIADVTYSTECSAFTCHPMNVRMLGDLRSFDILNGRRRQQGRVDYHHCGRDPQRYLQGSGPRMRTDVNDALNYALQWHKTAAPFSTPMSSRRILREGAQRESTYLLPRSCADCPGASRKRWFEVGCLAQPALQDSRGQRTPVQREPICR